MAVILMLDRSRSDNRVHASGVSCCRAVWPRPNEADTRGLALLYGSDQIYQTEIGTTVITIFHTILRLSTVDC